MKEFPEGQDIERAAERIRPYVRRTPVMTSRTISGMCGTEVFFKCENLQTVGAFKFRGACNAVFSLSDAEAERGVATHSSGNHAQALARAAQLRGVSSYIVMPENAPEIKKRAVAGYGASITYCAPTLQAREETLEAVVRDTGAAFIHPYDDWRIISGQATAARELLEEVPELRLITVPVGGGGLLAGTALSAQHFGRECDVVAAEPAGADDAYRSFRAGRIIPSEAPRTIADGLLTSLGERNFAVIQRHVRDIVTVTDAEILRAMRLVWERMKLVIEPSAAVPLAALLERRMETRGQAVGVVFSGGNLDLDRLPWTEARA